MPRRISPSSPRRWAENRRLPGIAPMSGRVIAPASSLCPDWEILGYHGTLWSSIDQRPRAALPPRTGQGRLLTAHKLKEWLPRTGGNLSRAKKRDRPPPPDVTDVQSSRRNCGQEPGTGPESARWPCRTPVNGD